MNNTDAYNMLGQLDRLIDLSNTAKKHVHNWDEVKTMTVLQAISGTARGLYEDLGTVRPRRFEFVLVKISEPTAFGAAVEILMNGGWELHGSPFSHADHGTSATWYCQALKRSKNC